MRKITLLLLATLATSLLTAQTATSILEAYYEALGGQEAVANLDVLHLKGQITQRGMQMDMEMYQKAPNLQRMNMTMQGQEITTAYDGATAWMINPMTGGQAQKLPPAQAELMAQQELGDSFLAKQEEGMEMSYEGMAELNGESYQKVKVVQDGQTAYQFFDPETHLLRAIQTEMSQGPMAGQLQTTYLSNYQAVEGSSLKMPYQMEAKVGENTMMSMKFEKVEVNGKVDEEMFAFPEG